MHIAAAMSVPNLRHVEWFSDHVRIEQLLFDGAVEPVDGAVEPTAGHGHGLEWKVSDAEQFRVG